MLSRSQADAHLLWLNGLRIVIVTCIPRWKGEFVVEILNIFGRLAEQNMLIILNSTSPVLNTIRYRATMSGIGGIGGTFLDIRTAVKLPDALRGEKYAFVGLPLAEFLPGGGIDNNNIGVGRLCPVDSTLAADSFVQGVVILTPRAKALASWLAGTEVAGLKADLRKRELVMETDIDNQYLMAKLNDDQRREAAVYEEGKDALNGLHFISVQKDEDDDPAGFWLLREIPESL
jgi:hypothetical protein|eukprot:scaffold139_cov199-Alexandrium_tamarense.AAC.9